MPTMQIEKFQFIHNPDFSGAVKIQRVSWPNAVFIPTEVLLKFAAQVVRAGQMGVLLKKTDEEVLGLKRLPSMAGPQPV